MDSKLRIIKRSDYLYAVQEIESGDIVVILNFNKNEIVLNGIVNIVELYSRINDLMEDVVMMDKQIPIVVLKCCLKCKDIEFKIVNGWKLNLYNGSFIINDINFKTFSIL